MPWSHSPCHCGVGGPSRACRYSSQPSGTGSPTRIVGNSFIAVLLGRHRCLRIRQRRPERSEKRTSYPMRPTRGQALAPVGASGSADAALEPAALPLGEAAPDAEPLIVLECVLQALGADLAAGADLLRLAGRAALLGEERLGIGLRTECPFLPAGFLGE